jgi:hypothetical protein
VKYASSIIGDWLEKERVNGIATRKAAGDPVWFCEPGHVALITGYNAKKKEIFRTDSWGEGARNRPVPVDEFSKRANGYLFFTPRE